MCSFLRALAGGAPRDALAVNHSTVPDPFELVGNTVPGATGHAAGQHSTWPIRIAGRRIRSARF
jgi:hypothetical protein